MKTYLVTGGAGFIGSNYIHYMFKKYGDTIRIINVDCPHLRGQSGEPEGHRRYKPELYLYPGGHL